MAMAVSSSSSVGLVSMFKGLSLSSSLSSVVGGASSSSSSSSLLVVRRERVSPPPFLTIESAHKKGSGSTKNGRDSVGKRLGVKIYGGQDAKPGSIIIRQRGTKFHPGTNVGLGRDYTIFSLIDGEVKFEKFGIDKKKVSVYPKIAQPENPNSRRARMREFFRLRRERRRGYEEVEVIEGTLSLASADSVEPDNDEKTLC